MVMGRPVASALTRAAHGLARRRGPREAGAGAPRAGAWTRRGPRPAETVPPPPRPGGKPRSAVMPTAEAVRGGAEPARRVRAGGDRPVRSWLPRREREAALGHARVGIDREDAQGGVRAGDGPGLADGLAQAGEAGGGGLGEQRAPGARRPGRGRRAQAQGVSGRGELAEAADEREAHAAWVGERLAERE